MPGGLPALPKHLGIRTTRSRIPEEAAYRHIKEELLCVRTSLPNLGTEIPSALDFGKGRPIMVLMLSFIPLLSILGAKGASHGAAKCITNMSCFAAHKCTQSIFCMCGLDRLIVQVS